MICCQNQGQTEEAPLPEVVAVLITSMGESGVFRKVEVVYFSGGDEPFGIWQTRLGAIGDPKDKVIHPLREDQPAVAEEEVSAIQARQVATSRAGRVEQKGLVLDLLMLSMSGPATALVHQLCGRAEAGNGCGVYLATMLKSKYESTSRVRLMDLNEELTTIALDSPEEVPGTFLLHVEKVIDQPELLILDKKLIENWEPDIVLGASPQTYAMVRTAIRSQLNYTNDWVRQMIRDHFGHGERTLRAQRLAE